MPKASSHKFLFNDTFLAIKKLKDISKNVYTVKYDLSKEDDKFKLKVTVLDEIGDEQVEINASEIIPFNIISKKISSFVFFQKAARILKDKAQQENDDHKGENVLCMTPAEQQIKNNIKNMRDDITYMEEIFTAPEISATDFIKEVETVNEEIRSIVKTAIDKYEEIVQKHKIHFSDLVNLYADRNELHVEASIKGRVVYKSPNDIKEIPVGGDMSKVTHIKVDDFYVPKYWVSEEMHKNHKVHDCGLIVNDDSVDFAFITVNVNSSVMIIEVTGKI